MLEMVIRTMKLRMWQAMALARRVGVQTALVMGLWTFSGIGPLLPKLIQINVSIPTLAFLIELTKLSGCLLWIWLYPLLYNVFWEQRGYRPELTHRDSETTFAEPLENVVELDRFGEVIPASPVSHLSPVDLEIEIGTPSKPLIRSFRPVRRKDLLKGFGWQLAWRFAIIAGLYVIVNNLKLYAQVQLDPGTFTLLNNISILTTALLYRVVMQRRLTSYQYVALIMLVTGLFTSKMTIVLGASNHQNIVSADEKSASELFARGLLVMIFASLSSSAADVGIEYAFKEFGKQHHFVAQSLSLYIFGVIFNALAIGVVNWATLAEEYATILNMGTEWILVLSYSINGLLIGLILRFVMGGNLTKMFVDAGALLETLIFETLLLHIVPGVDLLVGVVAIYCGIFIWSSEQEACDKLNGTVGGH